MAKLYCKYLFLIVAGLFSVKAVTAQDLPALAQDPAIKTGILPNGMSYYIVSNPSVKGIADFALVQRTGLSNTVDSVDSGSPVRIARNALAGLHRIRPVSPQDFLVSHGAVPGRNGFVKVTDVATEYHFSDIAISKPAVLDSTILLILDIADRASTAEDSFLARWYSPSDQAFILSGDVNVSDVEYKLRTLSLMTPAKASLPRKEYVWESCDTARYERVSVPSGILADLSLTWSSARTPREYMNTVQPVIYEMYLAQLGMLAEEGIREGLRKAGIPVAEVSFRHVTTAQSDGDETFTINVSVREDDFPEMVRIVSDVLSRIDSGYTDVDDVARVKQICIDMAHKDSMLPYLPNYVYVDKCMRSFLYNGSLATLKTKVGFLTSRHVEDTTELRLFNGISSALLDSEKNFTVAYSADMESKEVKALIDSSWSSAKDAVENRIYSVADIPAYQYEGAKMKIKSTKTEHMSNASVWTFSNGFTVIYRKMETGGRLYYGLASNGGYGSVNGLERGEGGYITDYFMLSKIGGIPADGFIRALNKEGISMEPYVGLTYMMLTGIAPENKAEVLLRALLAAVNDRVSDDSAAAYYAESEALHSIRKQGTMEERIAALDGIMCPDYTYSSVRNLEEIQQSLAGKADEYFKAQSEKMNDGALILLGNVDEAELKKVLLAYVGGFKTTDRAFRRPVIRYRTTSGCSTYTLTGEHNSIDVSMSVPLVLTTENVIAADVAAAFLEKYLSEAMIGTGMYVTVSHDCRVYPQERFNVLLSLNEANPDGLSSDTVISGPIEALSKLRTALSSIMELEVSDAEINTLKGQLKDKFTLDTKEPYYWLNVISRRYLSGKDFTTGYQSKMNSVNAVKVKELLNQLDKGSKVEYIISTE